MLIFGVKDLFDHIYFRLFIKKARDYLVKLVKIILKILDILSEDSSK